MLRWDHEANVDYQPINPARCSPTKPTDSGQVYCKGWIVTLLPVMLMLALAAI